MHVALHQTATSLPEFEDDFWKSIDNEKVKSILLLFLLSKLRACNPELMTESQLRSAFSEMKAYQKLIDAKEIVQQVIGSINSETMDQDEIE